MPTRISSRLTFLYKFVVPPLGIGFFLFFIIVSSFAGVLPGQIGNPHVLPWIALAAITIGTFFAYWLSFRLKEVWLDGDWLNISNFLATERIPLVNVEEIRCWSFLIPNLVKLRLSHHSQFGKSIIFVAPWRAFQWFFDEHPVVQRLRADVAKNRQPSDPRRK